MAIVTTDNTHYGAIAAAIREKNGDTAAYKPSEMAAAIQAIQAGSGVPVASVEKKDVNFYDYEGTLVASYTLAEAQALTALPDGPAHDGLVFQGWNWQLEDINALTHAMDVGAMYITDDGNTRLRILLWNMAKPNVTLYFSQTVANGVTVDWGDDSPAETTEGTGSVNMSHTYTAAGEYTISLATADGCTLGVGNHTSDYGIFGSYATTAVANCNRLQAVYLGANVTVGQYAFYNCYSLKEVTIPYGTGNMGIYVFYGCYSLKSITIPNSMTALGGNTFRSCYGLERPILPHGLTALGSYSFRACENLESITIPDTVTAIDSYTFYGCSSLAHVVMSNNITSIGSNAFQLDYSLTSMTVPPKVTSINAYAFATCSGMAEYHIQRATPPTLSATNAFNSIPSDCIIYVPEGSLETYQAATNWSSYASNMQEEPA